MIWTDLTDALFYRAYEHIFMIQKPRYRNDVVQWSCFHKESQDALASGKTINITKAKVACKEVYKQLKADAKKAVRAKPNGKLVYK